MARALVRERAVIMVADEPTAGMAPREAAALGEILMAQARAGSAVLVLSRATAIPGLAPSRLMFLDRGRIRETPVRPAVRRAS